jgi:pheromone alpha factor receptor
VAKILRSFSNLYYFKLFFQTTTYGIDFTELEFYLGLQSTHIIISPLSRETPTTRPIMDGIIESVQVLPNFDPSRQWFNLTVPDLEGGWGIMSFNMKVLDENRLINARAAISNGAGLGASIMFLVVLLLLTKSEKRKSFVFFLNAACLFTNTIRCLMACSRATGNFVEPYTALVMDPGRVTRADYAVLITGNVFGLIVAAFVYVSLSLQVWIVCITTPPLRRSILMGATITVACVAFALKLAIIYWNIKLLLTYESADDIATLNTVGLVMQTISIWFFSCVFTYKLAYAIIQRRRLNMPQFGPMQIVFIMGCQTMFIPGTSLYPRCA